MLYKVVPTFESVDYTANYKILKCDHYIQTNTVKQHMYFLMMLFIFHNFLYYFIFTKENL